MYLIILFIRKTKLFLTLHLKYIKKVISLIVYIPTFTISNTVFLKLKYKNYVPNIVYIVK